MTNGQLWDCQHKGHVWLTPDNRPYAGHLLRKRDAARDGLVEVHCQQCSSKATLPHFKQDAMAAARMTYGSPSASPMKHRH